MSNNQKFFIGQPASVIVCVLMFFSYIPPIILGENISFIKKRKLSSEINILLITTDDQGLNVGCYGDSLALTPNIDSLAGDGTLFTNAYVTQASCSPSRSSILTGLYPHQNGQIGLAGSHEEYQIKDGIPLLPNILRNLGYRTGIIGKLHLKPRKIFEFDFDHQQANNKETRRDVHNIAGLVNTFYNLYKNNQSFLYVNFADPHRPYDVMANQFNELPKTPYLPQDIEPLKFLGFENDAVKGETASYYNCINRVDVGIGLIIENLKKMHLYDRTLIIFLSDHGPPFARAKTTCYEAGTRIPFIIKWPGSTNAGSVRKEFISTIDIMPTILNTIGSPFLDMEGMIIKPTASDFELNHWRKYVFTEYTSHGKSHFFPRRAIRKGKYKLIHNLDYARDNPVPFIGESKFQKWENLNPIVKNAYKTSISPPEWELYNIADDPYEFNNIRTPDLVRLASD